MWPEKVLGPAPGLRELEAVCWALLASFLVLRFGVPLWIEWRTGAPALHLLPADFIYFYGIGRIVNEHGLAQLYNYTLQLKVFNDIYPLHDGAYGPSPYPPFVALFFSPFARLPFAAAFALWAIVSLVAVLAAVRALVRDIWPGTGANPVDARRCRSLAYCLTLGFYPLLMATLANGQLSAIAVFAVAMAVALESRDKPVASGLALSLLLYKPTLLLLLVPMLLCTRRFRALLGFAFGGAALAAISTAAGGFAIWPAYAEFIRLFGRLASVGDRSGVPLWKYVDLGSCLQAIAGGSSAATTIVTVALSAIVFLALCALWWKSANAGPAAQALAWAAAITWTLLVSVYVPIYDASLAAVAMILTFAGWKRGLRNTSGGGLAAMAFLLVAASWWTTGFAVLYHVQLLSLALAMLGLTQLALLYRAISPLKIEEN